MTLQKKMSAILGIFVLTGLLAISGCSYQSDISEDTISEDQAFAIAKQYVPASVLYAPNIITVLSISQPESHGFWSTFFDDLNITKQELIDFGWREDATTSSGETEPYSRIQIRIDAQTGEVVSKIAGNGIQLGGPPVVVPSS